MQIRILVIVAMISQTSILHTAANTRQRSSCCLRWFQFTAFIKTIRDYSTTFSTSQKAKLKQLANFKSHHVREYTPRVKAMIAGQQCAWRCIMACPSGLCSCVSKVLCCQCSICCRPVRVLPGAVVQQPPMPKIIPAIGTEGVSPILHSPTAVSPRGRSFVIDTSQAGPPIAVQPRPESDFLLHIEQAPASPPAHSYVIQSPQSPGRKLDLIFKKDNSLVASPAISARHLGL